MQHYKPYKAPPKSRGTLELEEIIRNKLLSDLTEIELRKLHKLGYSLKLHKLGYSLRISSYHSLYRLVRTK